MQVDPHWSEADRRQIVALYDGEIHYADRLVGRLLGALGRKADDTLVVLVADHGEELFDHGKLDHGHTLYDELLRVPLVMRFPGGGRPRARIAAQVQTIDLVPTVLEALAVPALAGIDGESLMPLVLGKRTRRRSQLAVSESVIFALDPDERAARLPDEKVIVSPRLHRASYFDLRADPREREDRAATHAERVRVLDAAMSRRLRPPPEGVYFQAVGNRAGSLHVRFGSTAGFSHVKLLNAEPDDHAGVAEDGHTLDVDVALRPRRAAIGSYDVDGVRFRTGDGEAPIVREATFGGGPIPRGVLVSGIRPGQTLAAGTHWAADQLVVRRPTLPRPVATRIALGFALVRAAAPASASFDADTVERLRALGYVR